MSILIAFAEDRDAEAPVLTVQVHHISVVVAQLYGDGADGRVARNLEGVPTGAMSIDSESECGHVDDDSPADRHVSFRSDRTTSNT